MCQQNGICQGGLGDMSWSLKFGIPLTVIGFGIPGWDRLTPGSIKVGRLHKAQFMYSAFFTRILILHTTIFDP